MTDLTPDATWANLPTDDPRRWLSEAAACERDGYDKTAGMLRCAAAALDAERGRNRQLQAEAKISGGQAAQESGRMTRLTQRAVVAERRISDLEAVAEAAREVGRVIGKGDVGVLAALDAALAMLEEPQ